ncbi:MAG: prepilin-type N-terminal cleavage/methylation domain-containing protein [bacterium]
MNSRAINSGFTLVELLITISITLALAVAAVPIYGNLQVSAQLNDNSSQITQTIRVARQRSLAGLNNSDHGVYFGSHVYTLFQGSSYASRDSKYDLRVQINDILDISTNLMSLGDEIVFQNITGLPNTTGNIVLRHQISGQKIIQVNEVGRVQN